MRARFDAATAIRVQKELRFGLTLEQPKRYWLEIQNAEEVKDRVSNELFAGVMNNDRRSVEAYERIQEQIKAETTAIDHRWGVTNEQGKEITLEGLSNQWRTCGALDCPYPLQTSSPTFEHRRVVHGNR